MPLKDLTGQAFGDWTVLERAENLGAEAAWLCRCTCGAEKVVRGAQLRLGRSKSCRQGYIRKKHLGPNQCGEGGA